MANAFSVLVSLQFRLTAIALVTMASLQCDLVAAELKLANIFSDHMVLQRDKPVPVWGWAESGDTVTVSFAGQSMTTTAGDDGKWSIILNPLTADANAKTLAVAKADGISVEVHDVLVGEVWLGSGQSNMAMTVERSSMFEDEKATAVLPGIRHFREASAASDSLKSDSSGTWEVCSPGTVGGFSATLFFCGRELHRELGVPIGLINSSVGGTPIESWIASEVQLGDATLRASAEAAKQAYGEFDEAKFKEEHDAGLKRWQQQVREARKAGTAIPARPRSAFDDRKRKGNIGSLFNGKIHPLIPFAIRGVFWYQGEANSRANAELYGTQLTLLVTDWRLRWNEELPFAWVQLPNYEREGQGWMEVRQQMLETLKLPNTGMAITTDVGDPKDIHPKNKQAVGKRLAVWALGTLYGKSIATSGPLPVSHEIRGHEVVVSFSHVDGGLVAKDGDLKGFELSDEKKKWHSAEARIAGDKVIVTSDAVASPVAIRFAWAANPDGNLYNGAGLPASPFRWAAN